MIVGWTPEQMGAAKAYYSQMTGQEPEPTLSEAIHIRMWWSRQPGGPSPLTVAPYVDAEWTDRLLVDVGEV